MKRVCVIDIGSNSIKTLIAERNPDGSIKPIGEKTTESRISKGMSAMRLLPESIELACNAVSKLKAYADSFFPEKYIVTATSAVRDASNRKDFCNAIKESFGLEVRILSGKEEASYIAQGALLDKKIKEDTFQLLDLGGGSQELIAIERGKVSHMNSLQLGAVRLTEQFVKDKTQPISVKVLAQVDNHVQQELHAAAFPFLEKGTLLVGMGGAVNYTRTILAKKAGCSFEELSSELRVDDLEKLKTELSALTLEERSQNFNVPPQRADIMPVALQTLITTAQVAGVDFIYHSMCNLRYGMASSLLA
jgi:exopolyphosphatase/guanosine-5'-triphosphate,3'-diphosphate pyrophosphatase